MTAPRSDRGSRARRVAGWSRLLSSALATAYDVSSCNLAVSGATSSDVLHGQRGRGVAHRPDLASLCVGVNDTS